MITKMLLALVIVDGAEITVHSLPTLVAGGAMSSANPPTHPAAELGRISYCIVPVAVPSFRALTPTLYLKEVETGAQESIEPVNSWVCMVLTLIEPEFGHETASSGDQVGFPPRRPHSQPVRSVSNPGFINAFMLGTAHLH